MSPESRCDAGAGGAKPAAATTQSPQQPQPPGHEQGLGRAGRPMDISAHFP